MGRQAGKKGDIKFTSKDGIWKIILYAGNYQDLATNSIAFSSDDPSIKVNGRSWQSKNLLTFRATTNQMFFEEKYQMAASVHGSEFVSKTIIFDKDNMRFAESHPISTHNENDVTTIGHRIVWEIRDGLKATPVKGNVIWLSHGSRLLNLDRRDDWLSQVKFVQFFVHDCNNAHIVNFNASKLIEIMGGREVGPAFGTLSNEALRGRIISEVSEGIRRLRTKQLGNKLFGQVWEQELAKYKASRKAGTNI